MGVCASDPNLVDKIDQHQHEKDDLETTNASVTINGGSCSQLQEQSLVTDRRMVEESEPSVQMARDRESSAGLSKLYPINGKNSKVLSMADASITDLSDFGGLGPSLIPSSPLFYTDPHDMNKNKTKRLQKTSSNHSAPAVSTSQWRKSKKKNKFKAWENVVEKQRRKESLQKKINILTFATQKIEKYKAENAELKEVNAELNEINGELKEYIDDKDEMIAAKETELKDLEAKLAYLEKEMTDQKHGNSINDILYKVQGDTVSKLKYTKMSAKRVIFITGINHLFYYDETESQQSEAKCIIVRDILISNHQIEKEVNDKPWFLILGTKRKALFIAETMATRDKWLNFVLKALNGNGGAVTINMSRGAPIRQLPSTSMTFESLHFSRTGSENRSNLLIIPSANGMHYPNIVTSPRSGNTKIMIDEGFEHKSLRINYASKVTNCTILNNGHTVQIEIGELNKCTLSMNDGNIFRLKSFHFHTPSEHTICNKQYEMELHLVHHNTHKDKEDEILILCFVFTTQQKYKRVKLELNEARTHLIKKDDSASPVTPQSHTMSKRRLGKHLSNKSKPNGSVTMESRTQESDDDETDVEEYSDEYRNDFLDQFWHQMPPQKTKENIPLSKALNFDVLFKNASNNFIKNIKTNDININIPIFDYVGSLRTPPYSEGVQWLIAKNTHFISHNQLNTLKKIWFHYL